MLRGLTTAASGLTADERLQQILANNLANAQTPGFKSSTGAMLEFPRQLLERIRYGEDAGPAVGKVGTGVVMQEGVPNFRQGDVVETGRNLDVAVVDRTPAGTYAAVAGPGGQAVPVAGTVAVGPGGRLEVGGRPLAVLDSQGRVIPGVYAVKNPAYQGQALYAADGRPNWDAAGNPSYVLADAAGRVVARPGDAAFAGAAVRIGTEADMGYHSFFAVAYQSRQTSGMALTRDGHFSLNSRHELVDAAGHPVLPVGPDGLPVPGARIVVNPRYQGEQLFAADGRPLVDKAGQPSYRVLDAAGNPVAQARLGLVDVDVSRLQPLGEGEFQVAGSLNPALVRAALRPGSGRMQPGRLEQSNVDESAVTTQMLATLAQYEANQRVIRTEDQLLGEAVQDVGKVNA